MSEDPHLLEVVVLGRVKGESILVRLGSLGWAVIDSFNAGGRPAALRWFDQAGIDTAQIRWVVATHWDSDHVLGLDDVIREAHDECLFAYPNVSDPERLAQLAATAVEAGATDDHEHAGGAFARVLEGMIEKGIVGKPIQACDLLVRKDSVEILAVSPTDRAVRDGLVSTGMALAGERPGSTFSVPSPNLTSIALIVTAGAHCVLLGGDLEAHDDYGWPRAITETADVRLDRRASLLKVPHHGSTDADHSSIWDLLLEPNPMGVVTPFGVQRPLGRDLERLSERCLDVRVAAGERWPGWEWVESAIRTAVPSSRVVSLHHTGWVRYVAREAGGWTVSQGVL